MKHIIALGICGLLTSGALGGCALDAEEGEALGDVQQAETAAQRTAAINAKWQANQWAGTLVGTTQFTTKPGARSTYASNAGYRYILYGDNVNRAHIVYGFIYGAYVHFGESQGSRDGYSLGFPTSDELSTPYDGGRWNSFEGGYINWRGDLGAFMTTGAIDGFWYSIGETFGNMGFPISHEYTYNQGGTSLKRSDFEGGSIFYRDGHGAWPVFKKQIMHNSRLATQGWARISSSMSASSCALTISGSGFTPGDRITAWYPHPTGGANVLPHNQVVRADGTIAAQTLNINGSSIQYVKMATVGHIGTVWVTDSHGHVAANYYLPPSMCVGPIYPGM